MRGFAVCIVIPIFLFIFDVLMSENSAISHYKFLFPEQLASFSGGFCMLYSSVWLCMFCMLCLLFRCCRNFHKRISSWSLSPCFICAYFFIIRLFLVIVLLTRMEQVKSSLLILLLRWLTLCSTPLFCAVLLEFCIVDGL